MIKYSPADEIMGKEVYDSRTGRALNKYCKLLSDPNDDYLKTFISDFVMNNRIHNNFSTVNN